MSNYKNLSAAALLSISLLALPAIADEKSDAEALQAEVNAMIEAASVPLWSTTVPVKGIKRKPLVTIAEEAIVAGDYAAATEALTLAKKQIELAQAQAKEQAEGGWRSEAEFLLGIPQ